MTYIANLNFIIKAKLKNPLISIIIPVYNSQETIKFVLQSIYNQTYKEVEVLLINDGSTDQSEKIINEFSKTMRLKYIFQKNRGVSSARNLGLTLAQGDYIMFLDSDDFWENDKIEKQLGILQNNQNIDFLGANRDGKKIKYFFLKKFNELQPISKRLLLYKNFFMTSSVVFKRDIVSEVGFFNEKMSYSEDWEYFLRIANKFNCYLYNESLVYSITNKPAFGHSGLSANLLKMEKGELETLKLGYKLNIVGVLEYSFIVILSFLKFLRRFVISKLRILKNKTNSK